MPSVYLGIIYFAPYICKIYQTTSQNWNKVVNICEMRKIAKDAGLVAEMCLVFLHRLNLILTWNCIEDVMSSTVSGHKVEAV